MLTSILSTVLYLASTASACASHDNIQSHPKLGRRQVRTIPQDRMHDWTYEASYNWGMLNSCMSNALATTLTSPI